MENKIIEETKLWIEKVVIGQNFCPFASKVFIQNKIRYQISTFDNINDCLNDFCQELLHLNENENTETTLLIIPNGFEVFEDYMELVSQAEDLIIEKGYEGIYQVASFHPDYLFAGSFGDDPANYTNRSLYPMLHILREDSLSHVIDNYSDTELIPERNITHARYKGLEYMKRLWEGCKING